MMSNNELLFFSKNEIPFPQGQISIHNPTINEIGLIGEKSFNIGSRFLNFSKENLDTEDKSVLENKTDFEIFMSVVNSRDAIYYKSDIVKVLVLLFPEYQIKFDTDKIILQKDDFVTEINNNNFASFKEIIVNMFCLEGGDEVDKKYNPADKMAARIAEKLKKRQKTLNKQKEDEEQKVSIYLRYVSILAVGLQKSINDLLEYTVYQLLDEFMRYQKKQSYDMYIQAKMAGAQDLEDVENWMEDIHS